MADPGTSSLLGAIFSGVGSLFGITESLFGKGGVSMPSLQIPQVQTFQIPQAQLAQLNQQIASNNQLSTQAQQVAQQALTAYSQGQLSSAYAAQYQQAANQLAQQTKEALAGQGLTLDSTQGQAAMQQLSQNLSSMKAQYLQKQLNDSLTAANLSSSQITSMENAWSTQAGITSANNTATINAANSGNAAQIAQTNLQQQQLTNKANTISNSAGLLGNSLNNILSGSGGKGTVASASDLMSSASSSPNLGISIPWSG